MKINILQSATIKVNYYKENQTMDEIIRVLLIYFCHLELNPFIDAAETNQASNRCPIESDHINTHYSQNAVYTCTVQYAILIQIMPKNSYKKFYYHLLKSYYLKATNIQSKNETVNKISDFIILQISLGSC